MSCSDARAVHVVHSRQQRAERQGPPRHVAMTSSRNISREVQLKRRCKIFVTVFCAGYFIIPCVYGRATSFVKTAYRPSEKKHLIPNEHGSIETATSRCKTLLEHANRKLNSMRGEFSVVRAVLHSFLESEKLCSGTFVELGANDGQNSHSNFLETYLNWRGYCIEAAPSTFKELTAKRPMCKNINAAVWSHEEDRTYRACTGKLYGHSGFIHTRTDEQWGALLSAHGESSKCEDIVVKARPITELVHCSSIDCVFLDVEGAEMNILKSWPWGRVHVTSWVIESNKLNRADLVKFMLERQYRCVHYDDINTFCVLLKNVALASL